MADGSTSKPETDGSGGAAGIIEMVNQGVEYIQSIVTGDSKKPGDITGSAGDAVVDSSTDNKASDIKDEHVSDFIRDKYKSRPGEWPEIKDNK